MQQNYSNHRRYVPGFHFVLPTLIIVLFIAAIVHLVHMICLCHSGACVHGMCCYPCCRGIGLLLLSIILLKLFWYTRQFPVKVQNRVIRAEENMRHFIMTGKPLDPRLTMGQVVALRFAGDDEYLALTERAIAENMKPDDIKKAIKNWRSDDARC